MKLHSFQILHFYAFALSHKTTTDHTIVGHLRKDNQQSGSKKKSLTHTHTFARSLLARKQRENLLLNIFIYFLRLILFIWLIVKTFRWKKWQRKEKTDQNEWMHPKWDVCDTHLSGKRVLFFSFCVFFFISRTRQSATDDHTDSKFKHVTLITLGGIGVFFFLYK